MLKIQQKDTCQILTNWEKDDTLTTIAIKALEQELLQPCTEYQIGDLGICIILHNNGELIIQGQEENSSKSIVLYRIFPKGYIVDTFAL